MASNGAQQYNTTTLRQLLLAAFTAEELRSFCYDRPTFRPIVDLFGPGHGKTDMVDRLVEYCDRHVLLDQLLTELKQGYPTQYARFEPHLLITGLEKPPAEKPARPTPEKPATAWPPAKIDSVTWLHISDLQFSTSPAYDSNPVLEGFLRDVVKCTERYSLHPDFIFVAGDIASSGNTTDYDLARQFFDELLEITHLDKARLFLVPGNHDVNRAQVSPGARTLGASLTDRVDVDAVLASPDDRQLMFARFAGYADFVNSYLGKHLPFDQEHYFYTRKLEWAGKQIALLGLNSAWLSASDHDEKEGLVIGERQVRLALDKAAGADLKIALLHHSFDRLRKFDRDDVEAMLCDDCDFVLHSHAGQTKVLRLSGPDAKAMVIAAGGHDAHWHPSSYNYVHLDLAAGAGTVHLRCYSPRRGGFWIRDTATHRNASTGRYRFRFSMEKPETEPKTLKRGDTIRDGQDHIRYVILELIREGGMARVWLAEQPEFGRRKVAIKEPLLRGTHQQEFERRFQQEIYLAAQLDRLPQVVRAYMLEHRADGAPLLVMEYIDGGSLADLMVKNPEGLSIGQALKISQEILKALTRFHRLPDAPVHRDIKPSNILLDPERGALLGDFGLAQLPESRDHPPLKSHPGTPAYMAPEQAKGLDPLTPAADLYAAGCVLFEMLTGKRYKQMPTGTRVRSIRQEVPAWLDIVVTKALAEKPSDRYGSAEDFATALAREGDLEAEAKEYHSLAIKRLEDGDSQGAIQHLETAARKYNELGNRYLRKLSFLRATRNWLNSHSMLVTIRKMRSK